jgi:hypothetical protein
MTRAATLDQPGLWDLPPEEPALPAPKGFQARTPSRRRHLLGLDRPKRGKAFNALDCDPACLVCGKAEGRGMCFAPARCAIACVHTAQPARVEVCIITHHVHAKLVYGLALAGSGRHRIAVITCPDCGQLHWHGATPGVRVRTGQCGAVYVVHTARATITNAGETR